MISKEDVQKFLETADLKYHPRQSGVSFPPLNRIFKKMAEGVRFDPIQVDLDHNLIIDGHHRYICLSMLKIEEEVKNGTKTSVDIALKWSEINIDPEDWYMNQSEFLNEISE